MAASTVGAEIDEDLQSRQMAVYGRESMMKLSGAHVLISGLNGLGAETAKNVVLANVKAVTLHDSKTATPGDLGSHFYLSPDDVGKNRASACVKKMQELNPYVAVASLEGDLPMADIAARKFNVVVLIEGTEAQAVAVDDACRACSPPVPFIRSDIRGVFGSLFCDFGPGFEVSDVNGEALKGGIVESISNSKPCKVQCVAEEEIHFDDGDYVIFKEVKGMTEINDGVPRKICNVMKGRKSFEIEDVDASSFGKYVSGGIVAEVKMPVVKEFRALKSCLNEPGEMKDADGSKQSPLAQAFDESVLMHLGSPNFATKFGRSGLLHVGFRAVDAFVAENGRMPTIGSAADADTVLALAQKINAALADDFRVEEFEADRANAVRQLAMGARVALNPLAAIFGGIVGQEVIKGCTGKFMPTFQYFYLDFAEALPAAADADAADLYDASRYGSVSSVFGKEMSARLADANIFLVGSGALGCEFLKNFALLGVGVGAKGKLTVTDDDIVEKSNLSRQFLFRNHHVTKSKSSCAAEAVVVMNPDLQGKCIAMQDRVAPTTESVFNDDFWMNLSGVVNALDNVKARLYVDQRCLLYSKWLLESGTLGTKCNSQVVLPGLTENYGAQQDPPEREAPQCAIHNFPHNIDHCLGLARSEFVGNYETMPAETNEFVAKGQAWVDGLLASGENKATVLEKLEGDQAVLCGMAGGMNDLLVEFLPKSFEDCISWARHKFESYFVNRIKQLTFNFPADAKNSSGQPFWSPPKRFPTPVPFNPDDAMCMQFIIAASNLRANIFGIKPPATNRSPDYFKSVLQSVNVPAFTPFADTSLKTGDEEEDARRAAAAAAKADFDTRIATASSALQATVAKLPGIKLTPEEFEKDHDDNHHMDFIGALANLRARNYGLDEVDKLQAKLKAGNIIPAIATATAMITGFVCMELLKIMGQKDIAAFRNSFNNLALPLFSMADPAPPAKVVSRTVKSVPDPINHPEYEEEEDIAAYPDPHTAWDKLTVPGALGMSLQDLVGFFKEKHGLNAYAWSLQVGSKAVMLLKKDNMERKLTDILESALGADVLKGRRLFVLEGINFNNAEGSEVEVPSIVLELA